MTNYDSNEGMSYCNRLSLNNSNLNTFGIRKRSVQRFAVEFIRERNIFKRDLIGLVL